ncbi:Tetratricopeptide repeat-containing protein [Prosthecobacter debontii]|uniref:Tetratricopeptide repeat-containing protein n=1 Tax=Prosthecobacter debontii TaxID=48467 RepID=A0A1T4YP44_9BACT|nr:tetratricopeptide repeat protein [Prosthecobacter debontii]SKB03607.1 Tetratricopeptide repeat-containing protein [Prosthecobacter debontii]
MFEAADNHMHAKRFQDALAAYQTLWTQLQEELGEAQQVWLLLSIANAAVRSGDYEEALRALEALPEHYADSGIVVGNPLFHLLVGLSLHGLNENPGGQIDNFARALICGGPEIFSGEDSSHLTRTKEILRPPAELGTWTGYQGCCRDLLNQSTGYLRDLLTKKFGSPPPYAEPH